MNSFDCSISSTLVELCVASEGGIDPGLIGVLELEVCLNELAATPFLPSNFKSMSHEDFFDKGAVILFGSLCTLLVSCVNGNVIRRVRFSLIIGNPIFIMLCVCILRDQSRTDCNLTYSHINLNL